jgi:CheY-like chemotaxis protein
MIILLVEDDLDRMKELKRCFESKSVKVITASSGSEARLILKRQSFDRIFSDINMPFGSGYALIENILKDGTKGSTPFFMYSSKLASDEDVEFAMDAGVDRYIRGTKPEEIVNEGMSYLKAG